MKNYSRYLTKTVYELSLKRKKMAFISGPRQSGKTTLAHLLSDLFDGSSYCNWDDFEFKKIWAKNPNSLIERMNLDEHGKEQLLILDEIHKEKSWKGKLKGFFDLYAKELSIVVTGSARLNVFKKGGDSLMGRYFHFRLHPFSLREYLQLEPLDPKTFFKHISNAPKDSKAHEALEALFEYGGFPEPLLEKNKKIARLWQRGRKDKIVKEDLRDISRIPELSRIEMMMALIPEKVGSLFSYTSLVEDLGVSPETIKRWIIYLGELYYLYPIQPYSKNIKRSLKKEPKIYLYDWSELEDKGVRFENMVASHLLKACHFWTDSGEGVYELRYLRNKEKKEVDFVVLENNKPWFTVECKLSETQIDPSFEVFQKALQVPHFQLCLRPGIYRRHNPLLTVMSFEYFFKEMV